MNAIDQEKVDCSFLANVFSILVLAQIFSADIVIISFNYL